MHESSRFIVAAALAGTTLVAACSLTDLDGFTGGTKDDGGASSSSSGSAKTEAGTDPGPSEAGTEAGATDPYGVAVLADAPSSWWRFEDAVGSLSLHDEMRKFDGQAIQRGSTAIAIGFGADGAVGKAAKFGNETGYFDIGDAYDFDGLSEFAIETWILDDSPVANFEAIFHKRFDDATGEPQNGWILFIDRENRYLGFQFWKNASVTPGVGVQMPTGFHHVVVTTTKRDGALDFIFYLDGTQRDITPGVATEQPSTTKHLTLGFNFNGVLDEMAVYEHPLPADRVLAHYQAAKP